MRWLAVICALASPASGLAQTAQEAVRLNLGLALELCARHLGNEANIVGAFQTAGFASAGTKQFGSSTVHRFQTPDAQVMAEVTFYSCELQAPLDAPTEGVSVVAAAFQQRLPGQFQMSGGSGNSLGGCASFFRNSANFGPLAVRVLSQPRTSTGPCVSNGRSVIFFEIPG